MKIQVIGSGSSGNCYLIDDGKTKLLLDAGLPFRKIQIALHFKLSSVCGCLVTHEHGDHSKAVKDLLKNGIDVAMSYGTAVELGVRKHHRLKLTLMGNVFQWGTFYIQAFNIKHDAKEPLGFLILSTVTREQLLYLTDTNYCPYRFDRLNYILMEINHDVDEVMLNIENGYLNETLGKRILRTHMSLDTAVEFLESNDLSQVYKIYICHVSGTNGNVEKFKEKIQKVTGKEVIIA
jgi:phosphoribosyl 1,2-cyclic phosphodiesterase